MEKAEKPKQDQEVLNTNEVIQDYEFSRKVILDQQKFDFENKT